MKKVLFGLGTLLMLFVMAACSSGVGKIECLTKDVEKKSEDWDKAKWTEVVTEVYETATELLDKDGIKEKDFDKITEAVEDFESAAKDSDTSEKYYDVIRKDKISKLKKKYTDKMNKVKKKLDD